MVKRVHKIIALAVLSIFALQLILPVFYFSAIQIIKISQQHLLANSTNQNLEKISLSETDFSKLKMTDEHEMIIGGTLYDVQSVKKENGVYIISAIADKKETAFQNQNTSLLIDFSNQKNSESQPVFSFLFFENINSVFHFPTFNLNKVGFISVNFISDSFLAIFIPPPKSIA